MTTGRAGRPPARRPGAVGDVRYPGRPLRLTRRGRIVVVAALTLVTLGALWVGARIDAASALEGGGREGLSWVVVRGGDTLWEIADSVTEGGDPAAVIRRIMDLNGLSDSVIRPGTRLYLPEGSAP
ncbi:LysM peptidoglycan-binding domain-containing protein [Streptosporangium minutum]|uniref:LysM peptidoglycan-binding domain-containing protein n=1 Tax=Streptosporangium minutum TaxID=569862 RepID=UPI0013FD2E9D|nr:LysM peptidoglycan-binding domain-containing protein [Streptosporangium minutum]